MALPSLPSLPDLTLPNGSSMSIGDVAKAAGSALGSSAKSSASSWLGLPDLSASRVVAFIIGFILFGIGLLGLIASGALSAVEGVQTHPAVRLAEKAGVA
jgi:hypothetical protein